LQAEFVPANRAVLANKRERMAGDRTRMAKKEPTLQLGMNDTQGHHLSARLC